MDPIPTRYLAEWQRQRWRLPIPLQRLDDELTSSWICRLVDAHADTVQTLGYRMIGRSRQLFCNDLDRGSWVAPLERLAEATGQTVEHLLDGSLRRYEGVLYGDLISGPATRWVLPIGKRGTGRTRFGMQYCSACLAADPRPYLRRDWRLAFFCWCPVHRALLRDRCGKCGTCVAPHLLRTGRKVRWDANSIVLCHACGADRRNEELTLFNSRINGGLDLQTRMLCVLHGESPLMDGRPLHPLAYFNGLSLILSFLDSPGLSADVVELLGGPSCDSATTTAVRASRYGSFERHEVDVRATLLGHAEGLLARDVTGMIDLLERAGCSSGKVFAHCGPFGTRQIPFWVWDPVHAKLDRTMYVPSDEEIEHAIDYTSALSHDGCVRIRDVCSVLGMKTNSSARVWQAIRRRGLLRRQVGNRSKSTH